MSRVAGNLRTNQLETVIERKKWKNGKLGTRDLILFKHGKPNNKNKKPLKN
jgi:hypothetical protein